MPAPVIPSFAIDAFLGPLAALVLALAVIGLLTKLALEYISFLKAQIKEERDDRDEALGLLTASQAATATVAGAQKETADAVKDLAAEVRRLHEGPRWYDQHRPNRA